LHHLRAALTDPTRRIALKFGRKQELAKGWRYEARVLGQYVDAVEDVIGQNVSPTQRAALERARVAPKPKLLSARVIPWRKTVCSGC
jgi:hypothetical protein